MVWTYGPVPLERPHIHFRCGCWADMAPALMRRWALDGLAATLRRCA